MVHNYFVTTFWTITALRTGSREVRLKITKDYKARRQIFTLADAIESLEHCLLRLSEHERYSVTHQGTIPSSRRTIASRK